MGEEDKKRGWGRGANSKRENEHVKRQRFFLSGIALQSGKEAF